MCQMSLNQDVFKKVQTSKPKSRRLTRLPLIDSWSISEMSQEIARIPFEMHDFQQRGMG